MGRNSLGSWIHVERCRYLGLGRSVLVILVLDLFPIDAPQLLLENVAHHYCSTAIRACGRQSSSDERPVVDICHRKCSSLRDENYKATDKDSSLLKHDHHGVDDISCNWIGSKGLFYLCCRNENNTTTNNGRKGEATTHPTGRNLQCHHSGHEIVIVVGLRSATPHFLTLNF